MAEVPFELKFKKTCFKEPHKTKKGAKRKIKKMIGKTKKVLDHVYFCEECSCWHTTSLERIDVEMIFRNRKQKSTP